MSLSAAALDWSLLSAFVHLVDAGSLSKAALIAGTTQPTLSRQIQQLETQLGLDLFQRSARGMRLTEAGELLVDRAMRMRDEAEGIARSAQGLKNSVSGTVRISASELTANHILPGILTRLHHQYPDIEFEVVASNGVANLLNREADIALRMVQPKHVELVARKVAELEVGIYAHKRYVNLHGAPESLVELLRRELIGFDRDDSIRKGLIAAGAQKGALRFAFRSDSHEVCWQMVRAGFGCGFITAIIAASDSNIVRLLPTAPVPSLPVWLTVHREVRSNKRLRVVYDAIAIELKRLELVP
jgi:DNA-binding transcriptional LysR family regulator